MKNILTLDSSMISLFLSCHQKGTYTKQGLVPRDIESEEVETLNMGSFGHKLLEIYYKARSSGESLNRSIDLALSYNPDTDTCECRHSKSDHPSALGISYCTKCTKCLSF